MNKIVHYIGLDVHKETIAGAIAPQNSTEVRRYGIIGGTLDAMDKLLKKLAQENLELPNSSSWFPPRCGSAIGMWTVERPVRVKTPCVTSPVTSSKLGLLRKNGR